METIYSRTDGWPSFACWQVACCQHFRLLSYREQQFRILIGTQKDILYSFFWAFTGTGRCTKENGGEERKLMYKYDSNAKMLSFCMMISACNILMRRIQKLRWWKRSKGYFFLWTRCSHPHRSASCCSNNKQFVTPGRINCVSSYAGHLEKN